MADGEGARHAGEHLLGDGQEHVVDVGHVESHLGADAVGGDQVEARSQSVRENTFAIPRNELSLCEVPKDCIF